MARKKKANTQQIGTYGKKVLDFNNRVGTYRSKLQANYQKYMDLLKANQENRRNEYYQQVGQQTGQDLMRTAARVVGTQAKQTVTLDDVKQQAAQRASQNAAAALQGATYKPAKQEPKQDDLMSRVMQVKKQEDEKLDKWNQFVLNSGIVGQSGINGAQAKAYTPTQTTADILKAAGNRIYADRQKKQIESDDVLLRAAAKDYAAQNKPQGKETAKFGQVKKGSQLEEVLEALNGQEKKDTTPAAMQTEKAMPDLTQQPQMRPEQELPAQDKVLRDAMIGAKQIKLNQPETGKVTIGQATQETAYKALGVVPKEPELDPVTKQIQQQIKRTQQLDKLTTGEMEHGTIHGSRPQEVSDLLTENSARASRTEIEILRKKGYFDDQQYEPQYWSDSYREEMLDKYNEDALQRQANIEELNQQIEANSGKINRWEPLLSLYTSPEIENEQKIINGEGYTDEQKKKAQETLDILMNKTKGAGSQSIIDKAKNFLKYNEKNLSYYRDHMNMDSMRRMAYDAMNGNGAYEQIMSGLDEQGKQALNDRIDTALDYVADPAGELGVKLRTEQGMLSYDNSQIEKIMNQNRWEETYRDLMSEPVTGDTEYDEKLNMIKDPMGYFDKGSSTIAGNADYVYSVLGGGLQNADIVAGDFHKAALMNRKERDKFISLYKDGKKAEAWAFYQGIEPMLNQTYSMYETLSMQDTASRFPILSSGATLINTLLQPAEMLVNFPNYIRSLAGIENSTMDPNSEDYLNTRMKSTVRQAISKDLGDWGWVYEGLMSGADSSLNFAIARAIGLPERLLQYGTLALFGSQAFETSLQQNLKEHRGNFAYDMVEAALDAAIETATEIWTVENFMREPTNLVRFAVRAAVSEPAEEIVGAIAEPYIKELFGHQNQYKQRAAQILGNGGYYDDKGNWIDVKDMDSATRQAMREWNHDIRMAAQEALISVGPMIGYQGARMVQSNIRTGRAITGDTTTAEERVEKLLGAAESMGPESDSGKLAEKIRGREASGKKASNYQLGQLANDTLREASASGSPEKVLSVLESVDPKQAGTIRADLHLATEREIEDAEGERIKGPRGVIYNSKDGRSVHARLVGVTEIERIDDETGKKAKVPGVVIEVDGKLIPVDAAQVLTTSMETGSLLREARENPVFDANYTKLVLEEMDAGKEGNPSILTAPAEAIRLAAYMGRQMPKTGINEETAKRLYDYSVKQREGLRRRDIEGQKTRGKGKGTATFKGVQYGTQEYQEAVKKAGLTRETRNRMGAWAEVARVAGIDLVFRDNAEIEEEKKKGNINFADDERGLYGSEGSNQIMLNIEGETFTRGENGEKVFTGIKRNIGVAFGHEFIHWLQEHSYEAYNALEKYVLEQQAKYYEREKGSQAYLGEQLKTIARARGISMHEAILELVAESCDRIMLNEDVLNHLQETNKSLYEQFKGFVKDLVARVRAATKNLEAHSSRYAGQMESIHASMKEIARLVNLAYDEATGKVVEAPAVTEEEPERTTADYVQAEYVGTGEARTVQARITNPLTMRQGEFSWMPNQTAQALLDSKAISLTEEQRDALRKVAEHAYADYAEAWDQIADVLQEQGYDGIRMADGQYIALKNTQTAEDGETRLSQAEMDAEYEQAVKDKNTAKQEEMVKAAAQKAGYTKKVYHGTPYGGFTQFRDWSYFTENKEYADRYNHPSQSSTRGYYSDTQNPMTYALYMNPGRVFDTRDPETAKIYEQFRQEYGLGQLTENGLPDWTDGRDIIDFIEENNLPYDTIILNEGADGGYGAPVVSRGVSYVTRSNMVKSAEPVTYDDNGNMIPLSERFNPEKTDIRYSKADNEEDIKIKTQVNNNIEKILKIDPVADISSEIDLDKYYKQGARSRFAAFKMWMNDVAEQFGRSVTRKGLGEVEFNRKAIKRGLSYLFDKGQIAAFKAVPNVIENGIEINDHKKHKGRQNDTHTYAAPIIYDGETKILAAVVSYSENTNRYKTHKVYMPDGTVLEMDEEKTGVAHHPEEQSPLRAHTPVSDNRIAETEEKGKSQAENALQDALEHPKQRFSMADPVEATKQLVAVHNLTEKNLLDTLSEGGFTAPSIAIIRAAMGHSKYGEISVLFRRDTIDPRKSSKNKVYGTDAWTPTRGNAQIETRLVYEEFLKAQKQVEAMLKDVDPYYAQEAARWIGEKAYNEETTKTIDQIIEEAAYNEGMLAAYYTARGKQIDIKYRTVEDADQKVSQIDIPLITSFLETLERLDMLDKFMENVENGSMNFVIEQWAGMLAENGDEHIKNIVAKAFDNKLFAKEIVAKKLKSAYRYEKNGRQVKTHQEIDRYATKDAMREHLDKEDFRNWFMDLLGKGFGERGIYNGEDPYTPYGTRRRWSTTHWPVTAENIVRAMYRNHEAKGGEAGRATGLMARASKEYRTISEIRADSGRLQMLSEEEYKEKVEQLDQKLVDFVSELAETSEYGTDTIREILIDAAATYARTESLSAFVSYMKREGITMTEEQAQKAKDLLEEAREIPTGYFEAKPERVVGLDEIDTVLIPADASKELIRKLEERGIPYEMYDGTDEDRLEKLNEHKDVRFSQADMNDIDVETWMETRSPGSFRTEDERIMWETWKRLRNDVRMVNFRIEEYKKQIRALEQKESMTAEEREQLRGLKNKLEVKQAQLDRLEKELRKTTGTEGFATMMRDANLVIGDFMAGKTSEQVTAAVDTMTVAVERADKEMAQQEKALAKLAEEEPVKVVQKVLKNKGLKQMVQALRSNFSTTMSEKELSGRVAEIILKGLKGEDVTADIEALASDVVSRQRGYGNVEAEEALSALRGRTIMIGPGQQAELKANHLTLKDLRARTKGSGIKFVFGERSTLDTDAEELIAEVPALRGLLDNEKASLENFVGYVENLLSLKNGTAEENGVIQDDVSSFISNMITMMLNENLGGVSKAELIDKLKNGTGQIGTALAAVRRIRASLGTVKESGERAQTWTGVLRQDMDTALNYYDQVARLAARQERTQVRKTLIEQLRAENTKKLMQQQEKYEQMMKNDRTARQLANDNMTLRSKINTAVKRISRLMTEETDLKNIPEEAKPLARLLVKMFVDHDSNYRRVTFSDNKQLQRAAENIQGWEKLFGGFDYDHGLDWLVTGEGDTADTELRDAVEDALVDIETGLMEYRNAEGRGTISLQDRKNALTKIQDAVAKIYNVIQARRYAEIDGKRALTAELAASARDDMQHSRFRGEWTGWLGRRIGTARRGVIYGNMTPVYFFKNLRNGTLSSLFRGYESAENKNGLAIARAQAMMQKIAQETGYGTWDQERRYEIQLEKGGTVRLTLGEMMSLYATWQREMMNQLEENGPEKSFHLTLGGFITEPEQQGGVAGRQMQQQRPHRLTEGDMAKITAMMTPQQIEYVTRVVEYMTKEIGELGNEASMRMYGIRKFNEKWYFPFEVWRGVMSSKSTAGVQNAQQNAAAHQSFTKRRMNNARNALMIRDFTQTAARHIVAQINYNTFAPAIEWMQRVMNSKQMEGEDAESMTERNLWAMFQEVYGKDAYAYFKRFQQDMNGGATQQSKDFYDRLISTFRKSAVAGSLSVAAQQPLSYIRAAMEISPRWLVEALNPRYYRGSNAEMEKWSGVAVLKRMGKFDMGFGETAAQYIAPEARQSMGRRVYETASDWTTALPELMDRVTWTRMWTAAKLEQAHLHPEMDPNSDEFMELVAERFNDIIRRTQVYDSTLVRSQNMRAKDSKFLKTLTSFMAEPTLTANVLVDSLINVRQQGGMRRLATAASTFILSAIAQAAVKGTMGAGRNPDKKKTWEENWWYRFMYNFISEANPVSLIPGYSDLMTLLKKGELNDDAMGMIGKLLTAAKKTTSLLNSDDPWRDVEDSVGVIAQLFSNIPVKNLMRDARAMYNFFTQPYAQRETSQGVLRYQLQDQLFAADNLMGAINTWLGNDGYKSTVDEYALRIYQAQKSGDEEAARLMSEYVTLAKSGAEDPEKALQSKLKSIAKKDKDASAEETMQYLQENGGSEQSVSTYIMDELKDGKIDAEEARKLLKQNEPDKSEDDIWWKVDRAEYAKENGTDTPGGYYYRLTDAVESNRAEEINKAVNDLKKHGVTDKQIKTKLSSWKQAYLDATGDEKRRIRDALTKAYKAIGLTAEEAGKIIDGWKKESKKDSSSLQEQKETKAAKAVKTDAGEENDKDTTGRYGKGNIDLNKRQVYKHPDGSISTELSFSFYDEQSKKEVLIPTVINGKIVSDEEAIDHYYKTGEYLGKFDTWQEADEYAEMLHNRQDWFYHR